MTAQFKKLTNKLDSLYLFTAISLGVLGIVVSSQAYSAQDSFAPIVEKVRNAVVNISSTGTAEEQASVVPQFPPGSPFEEFFKGLKPPQGQARKATSLGSGFIIDPKGFIVTNNHVIENGTDIKITLQDGTILPATIVGRDARTDLALLKVKTDKKLTSVEFADSDKAKIGDWIIAVGNPYALGGTVTAGIISARSRDIQAGPYDDFLQIDAPINHGNSGGPTFNTDGQVIGVNTAILSPGGQTGGSIGIGFAIPSNIVKNIVTQLMASGKVKRGFIGVQIQLITPELADSMNLKSPNGTLVTAVTPKTPAEDAGIEVGDVITRFNNKDISVQHDLPRIVAETTIGSTVDIEIIRNGKPMSKKITVAELQEEKIASKKSSKKMDSEKTELIQGMKLEALTDMNRKKYQLGSAVTNGLVVVGVSGDSKAAELGIAEGDVIVRINDLALKTPNQLREQIKKLKAENKKSAALYISSRGRQLFVALPIGNADSVD